MVRIVDDIGTVHSVKVRAESLYEAVLLGLNALSRVGWEDDGETVGRVLVEVHYEPTSHEVNVPKFPSMAEQTWEESARRKAEASVEGFDEVNATLDFLK